MPSASLKPKTKFTAMKQAFAREYVIDRNGAAAAVRAGYSPKTAKQRAHTLLCEPEVKEEIDRLTQAVAARAEERMQVNAQEVIENLTNIMRADIRDVLEWGSEQRLMGSEDSADDSAAEIASIMAPFVRVKSAEELPRSISGAIAEVSLSAQGTFKIKMHDKGAAIDKLMRHLGLYKADNEQKTDPLSELIKMSQGTALPVATRYAPHGNSAGDNG